MKPIPANNTLRRFFSGIAEYVFQCQLGVVDPPVVDYLTDMLMRFVRHDLLYRIRDLHGRPLTEVVEMLLEAENRIGDARREIHRHIGDYTLFWTGIYPEALRRMTDASKKDHFVDYCQQGKRAYMIASEIEAHDEKTPRDVLVKLSDHFEMCAYGLREVRRAWENQDDDPAPGMLLVN